MQTVTILFDNQRTQAEKPRASWARPRRQKRGATEQEEGETMRGQMKRRQKADAVGNDCVAGRHAVAKMIRRAGNHPN